MPKTQEYRLKGPTNADTTRRLKEFMNSRENSIFPIIEIKSNPNPPYFLNFEIFVSSQHIDQSLLPEPLFIIPSPLSDRSLTEKGIVSRTVDVELGNFGGSIVIRSTKIGGSLRDDIVIVAGNTFDTSKTSN